MGYISAIRVLALGIIRDRDRIFISQGYDQVKDQTFYRALGGGIDFGESSEVALVREFEEELQAEIINIQYLGCLENLFNFDGNQGHEIIQLYSCDFSDRRFYELDQVQFQEGKRSKLALWVETKRFLTGELILYPQGMEKFLV
jgi:8-oxo-dGTP pyrophosphatase MutT (NUDIX family)